MNPSLFALSRAVRAQAVARGCRSLCHLASRRRDLRLLLRGFEQLGRTGILESVSVYYFGVYAAVLCYYLYSAITVFRALTDRRSRAMSVYLLVSASFMLLHLVAVISLGLSSSTSPSITSAWEFSSCTCRAPAPPCAASPSSTRRGMALWCSSRTSCSGSPAPSRSSRKIRRTTRRQ